MPSAADSSAPLAATTEELLLAIRLRFYTHRIADYHRDRQRLLYAVTWPAAWLDERGLTCAPQRYQTLIEERLQIIAAHHDCTRYDAYFSSYLLKCLQDWFDRYSEELYSELKHIRNALGRLLASARFAERVQRHARHLDVLVAPSSCVGRRRSCSTSRTFGPRNTK